MDAALRALAAPRRREILRLVLTEELSASEIASRFVDVTRPAISQHLGVLRDAHLISERRDGTRRLYRSNPRELAKLRDLLDEYWNSGLERLKDAAEAAERERGSSDVRTRA